MPKQWKTKPTDLAAAQRVAEVAGLPPPIACVVAGRGHVAAEGIGAFLDPRLADLADPFLLPGMRTAVKRLWQAIDGGETIAVFGDYDVDGVTAAALLVRVLAALGGQVRPFIPDRLDEGYGLSSEALDRCLAECGPQVVVSVDCGTNSADSVAAAQARGIDVVVTDHHEPSSQVAPAHALINPKLGTVPALENLSGAGVAFKLAHALVKTGKERGKASADAVDLRDYLDIAALGIVADIVPLTGENRILVRHGLPRIDASKWVGMEALRQVAGVKGETDTYHCGFQLGPRINAAGRIGQPMQALRLLTTDDTVEAWRIARLLDETNAERRRIEGAMAQQAFAEIDAAFDPARDYGLVVAHEGWHPGVVGIVAARVARHYNRPAIVMGIEPDGSARGSCRSIDEFDMLDGLNACAGHLSRFGGHRMAAGLAVRPGALEAFREAFNAAAGTALSTVDLAPVQWIDAPVEAGDLDRDFMAALKKLAPFGQEHPEPVWALRGARVAGVPRVVGGNHLKLSVAAGGRTFEAIAFNYPLASLPAGTVDIAFLLKENRWNGQTSLQLVLQDVRPAK